MQSSLATRWIGGIRTLKLRSEPLMYAQELTHPYSGPTEGLVAYLAANAKPGQTVLTNYEDLPLQFYTCLLYTSPSPRDRTRPRMPPSA